MSYFNPTTAFLAPVGSPAYWVTTKYSNLCLQKNELVNKYFYIARIAAQALTYSGFAFVAVQAVRNSAIGTQPWLAGAAIGAVGYLAAHVVRKYKLNGDTTCFNLLYLNTVGILNKKAKIIEAISALALATAAFKALSCAVKNHPACALPAVAGTLATVATYVTLDVSHKLIKKM